MLNTRHKSKPQSTLSQQKSPETHGNLCEIYWNEVPFSPIQKFEAFGEEGKGIKYINSRESGNKHNTEIDSRVVFFCLISVRSFLPSWPRKLYCQLATLPESRCEQKGIAQAQNQPGSWLMCSQGRKSVQEKLHGFGLRVIEKKETDSPGLRGIN